MRQSLRECLVFAKRHARDVQRVGFCRVVHEDYSHPACDEQFSVDSAVIIRS